MDAPVAPAYDAVRIVPADFGRRGAGGAIRYGIFGCPFGRILIARAQAGICFIALGDGDESMRRELLHDYSAAAIDRDDAALREIERTVAERLQGRAPSAPIVLELRYTPFQLMVWRELCAIPPGRTRTYGEIARRLGRPAAARAVGRAGALNPVSILIPCHRAVGQDGALHGYRWGLRRKAMLLAHERECAARSR